MKTPIKAPMKTPMKTTMKTPVHVWIVGSVTLLWNAIGAANYLMTQTADPAMQDAMTPDQWAFVKGLPLWVISAWAIAVWAAVAGSLLLLARRRIAAGLFGLAFIALILTLAYEYGAADALAVMGQKAMAFSGILLVIAAAEWEYARRMVRAGVLR